MALPCLSRRPNGPALRWRVRGLAFHHRYGFRVRAVNSAGTGPQTPLVYAMPIRPAVVAVPPGQRIPLLDLDRQSLIVRLAGQDCRIRVWWQPSDLAWYGGLEVPVEYHRDLTGGGCPSARGSLTACPTFCPATSCAGPLTKIARGPTQPATPGGGRRTPYFGSLPSFPSVQASSLGTPLPSSLLSLRQPLGFRVAPVGQGVSDRGCTIHIGSPSITPLPSYLAATQSVPARVQRQDQATPHIGSLPSGQMFRKQV